MFENVSIGTRAITYVFPFANSPSRNAYNRRDLRLPPKELLTEEKIKKMDRLFVDLVEKQQKKAAGK